MMSEIKLEAVDLGSNGLFVYQNKNGYTLSSDAVMLANYVKCKSTDTVVDLCSGSGIIGILVYIKNNPKKTYLVEIQKSLYELSLASVRDNGYINVECINHDARDLSGIFKPSSVDVVMCNPPYFRKGEGKLSGCEEINIARHELKITLDDIICESSKVLKTKGHFYMVLKTYRLYETLNLLSKYNMGAKEVRLVFRENKIDSDVFMVTAQKGYVGNIKFTRQISENPAK